MLEKTVLLICDVWDNHYCKDLRRRTESLVGPINGFAAVVRKHGGRVLHCPSDTVDDYYYKYPQRIVMSSPYKTKTVVSEKMRQIEFPLDTTVTTGCPDTPQCRVHTEFTKQHDGIEIHPKDLISDRAQEIYNFLTHEKIERVLVVGTVLNMCILGRPFGVEALVEWGLSVSVVSDLVEVFYNPVEPPYITQEQAKWFALGYIESKWCSVTNCYKEIEKLPKERNMKIHSNIPGALISRLKKKYQLEYFVETGTAYGDTAEWAAAAFDRVWSCDIDANLIARSKKRLEGYPDVEFSIESSPVFLRRIKQELTKPTLYWLDAHWCGGRVKPERECPLLEELEAIGSFYGPFDGNSVIVIDDFNLIEAPPNPPHDPKQWPILRELQDLLNNWEEPYDCEYYQGSTSKVVAVTPKEKK